MTWKDQINQILRDYQEGQVCADCIAALLPELTLADIYKAVRTMRGWPYYVSNDENKCSRCGNTGEAFACD